MRTVFTILTISVICFITCKEKVDNNVKATESEKEEILLGTITKNSLVEPNYVSWFKPTYAAYNPNSEILDQLNTGLNDATLKVFMGTWCEDSQREIPAFFKLLDQIAYPSESIEMVAVDRDKLQPEDALKGYDIEFVPTIIVSRNGEEIGRIIEAPEKSLEEDLLNILMK